MMKRNAPLQLSVRSQMLVEKMNAFYLRNWDKEAVFDMSQRVFPRRERHWWQKQAPRNFGHIKTFKHKYTSTPYHKSDDGQSPGDIMLKDVKQKYFWVDPSADYFLHKDLPGGHRDYHLAWETFYKELEKAAYIEPEQVFTLLHDLTAQGWEVPVTAYERAEMFLNNSRSRRVRGIKPPQTIHELKGKERWPGDSPLWDEEWDPVRPFTYYSQANPQWSYKPVAETDWVHDSAPWRDGPLPYPQTTRHEEAMRTSSQRKNIMLQMQGDERYRELLDGENKDLWEQWKRDPESFTGDPSGIRWLVDENDERVTDDMGSSLMLHTDIEHFISLFFDTEIVGLIYMWRYTSGMLKNPFLLAVYEDLGMFECT